MVSLTPQKMFYNRLFCWAAGVWDESSPGEGNRPDPAV